jgi:hypothetical protein
MDIYRGSNTFYSGLFFTFLYDVRYVIINTCILYFRHFVFCIVHIDRKYKWNLLDFKQSYT